MDFLCVYIKYTAKCVLWHATMSVCTETQLKS